LFAAVALGLFACGSSPRPARPTAPLAETSDEAPATEAPPTAEKPGNENARAALDWVVAVVNERDGVVDKAEVERRFAPAFLARVPSDQVIQVFATLAQQFGDVTVSSVADDETPTSLAAVLATQAGPVELVLRLEAAEPHRLETLVFQPAAKHATFEEATQALAGVGDKSSLYAARIDKDGACAPVFDRGGDQALAIGSAFKLYVLAALVEQIQAGAISWDQEVAVSDKLKSLSSGELQDAPEGFRVSVTRAAEAMIAVSDNTATDLLMNLVGRKRVEAAAKKLGNNRNVPFFTTRELFLLKLVASDFERSRYSDKRQVAKRSFLNGPLSRKKLPTVTELESTDLTKPLYIDTFEWFATGPQVCAAMSHLMKTAADTRDEVLRGILSKNPGMAVDKNKWVYVAFKGGSEPGVLNLTFLLIRRDGQTFCLVVTVNDTKTAFEQETVLEVAKSAVDLLGRL